MANLAKVTFFTEFSTQRKELRAEWDKLDGVDWEEYLQAKDDEVSGIEDAYHTHREKKVSAYPAADRKTTTVIIKREIKKRWPDVQDLSVKTDVFSGGYSMHVRYKAPFEIIELEAFIDTFQEGSFNGMEDIYEYNNDGQEVIIEGHILQAYKYCFTYFEGVCDPKPIKAPISVDTVDRITITENEAKNGIEIAFPGKPDANVIAGLKTNGFRWSMRLKLWYAKRSESTLSFAKSLTA